MSRTTPDITFDVTSQTVEYRVPQGRPTSATFDVFSDSVDDAGTAEFSGTATVLGPSTTVDANSGPSSADPKKLNLTATTDIATGRKYLVAQNSRQEWVEPVAIVSADYIICRHPLQNDYTSGATFVSTSLTAAIDSTFVADEGNLSDLSDPNPDYRVRWAIVVSGVTYIAYSYFDLVRAGWRSQVDIQDLEPYFPTIRDMLPLDFRTEDGRPLIAGAERALRAAMIGIGLNPDSLRDDEEADELVILAALKLAAEGGIHPPTFSAGEFVTLRSAEFHSHFQQHFKVTNKHKIDTGTGGAVTAKPQFVGWSK